MLRQVYLLSGNSAANASTVVVARAKGLLRFNWFTLHANLVGATGGTLNVRVQRLITDSDAPGVWSDWVAFPQLTAGAAAISYATDVAPNSAITQVGGGTTAAPTVQLAAGTVLGGHPGNEVRLVATTGAGTSAAAAVAVYLVAQRVRA